MRRNFQFIDLLRVYLMICGEPEFNYLLGKKKRMDSEELKNRTKRYAAKVV